MNIKGRMEDNMSDFFEKIEKHKHEFSNSQKRIAKFLKDSPEFGVFRSLQALAKQIGVSTTSIIRFSRVLGYDGFAEMKNALQESYFSASSDKQKLPQRLETLTSVPDNKLLSDSFENDIQNIIQTLSAQKTEDINRAVDLISEASSVYVLGLRTSFSTAYYTASRLGEIRHNVHLIQSPGMLYPEEIVNVGSDDVCIAYLFPRYSKVSSTIVSWMKNSGCRIVLITSLNCKAVSGYGDVVLPCAISSLSYKNSFAAPICLCNYLINALVRKKPNEAREILEKTEEILDQGFYLGL